MDNTKLTHFSPGAGCGCKISPAALKDILRTDKAEGRYRELLVGNESSDDAAVFDLGDGRAVISTTDFFMPITDDAFDFGRIAAANALSDVYAMGGRPLMAVAILGWPLEKLSTKLAATVLDGARAVCGQAGIPLAGGHSIDSLEPIFGLAVTGLVAIKDIKRNSEAKAGDMLLLTKALGTGIISTAQKRGILKEGHFETARDSMVQLNNIGALLGSFTAVHAMTDVTGFGLLGHLLEMCQGSGVGAEINFDALPIFPELKEYLNLKAIPGGTSRNWKSYSDKVSVKQNSWVDILCDPQTSGGLLVAVARGGAVEIRDILMENKCNYWVIGSISGYSSTGKIIQVV